MTSSGRRAARARLPLLLVPFVLALGACAPRATDPGRAVATTDVSAVTYYPSQTGLSWSYLPEGAALDSSAYSLTVQGATLFGDQAAVAFRFVGRGADQTSYRQFRPDGQYLLGFTKPGVVVSLTPGWREYPQPDSLKAGLQWSGESSLQVVQDGKVVQSGVVRYRYTVLEQRPVVLTGGERLNVWVINRQIDGESGGVFPAASQELWFAPYLGEVRTPEGLLQVARSYRR
ncbi:hypothetical protein [Deinococcus pimensis]|uniref:hypothetical protein n=1 Tax=Deinococcus pimensis TaxID=309888 RepID=UPI000489B757|nr:hypothetical protein [Deinococcus pimensis]